MKLKVIIPMTPRNPLIIEIIKDYSDGNNEVARLLALSVGRVLNNADLRHEDWEAQYQNCDVGHIKDWLKAALVNNDSWLANVDGKGRPLKLMKFSNLDQITQEADKAMMKANQKKQGIQIEAGEEELVATLKDGYYLVELLTPNALDKEGSLMQHCVGQGAYDDDVENGDIKILSLRDQHGKPHATIELRVPETAVFHHYEIAQIQGKQNKLPIGHYLTVLKPYLEKEFNNFQKYIAERGIVSADDGLFYSPNAIPVNTTVYNLIINQARDITLPNGLTVLKSFNISRSSISKLPDDINLMGNATFQSGKLTKFPDSFKVGGHLDIRYHRPIKMPDGLSIGGDLIIAHIDILELPEGLKVGRDLRILRTGRSEVVPLPEGIEIGRHLIIEGSYIKHLPDNLKINGQLLIRDTPINTLPSGLECRGNIDIRATNIENIPSDIVVRGYIKLPRKIMKDNNILSLPDCISDDMKIDVSTDNSITPKIVKLGHLRNDARLKNADGNAAGYSM